MFVKKYVKTQTRYCPNISTNLLQVKTITGPVTYAQAEGLFKAVAEVREKAAGHDLGKLSGVLNGESGESEKPKKKKLFGQVLPSIRHSQGTSNCVSCSANIEFAEQSYAPLTLEDLGPGVDKLSDVFNVAASGFDVRNEITFDLEANRMVEAVAARLDASVVDFID